MLLVRTTLKVSSRHGIGLFAAEYIPLGATVWRYSPTIDLRLSEQQLNDLAPPCREQVSAYAYRQRHGGLFLLCGDDARFMNHSDKPNCVDVRDADGSGMTLAATDICPGDEITCDYSTIDQEWIDGKYRL